MILHKIRKSLPVCVILVLLVCMLAGCGEKGVEPTTPNIETTVDAETVSDTLDVTDPQETEITEPEVTEPEATEMEDTEDETEAATEAEEDEEVTEPEQEETVAPTEAIEEQSSPLELQLSNELSTLKGEYDTLQNQYDELEAAQAKTKNIMIIACVAAGVFLLLAICFFLIWRKADKILRRRRRKALPAQTAGGIVSGVTVGKAHGIGRRSSQQDSFSVTPEENYGEAGVFAVVADGMGGLKDGDKVSQMAVMSAMEYYLGASGYGMEKIVQILSGAKAGVDNLIDRGEVEKSGTTLLLGLLQDGMFHYASVGDSRICLYRGGELINLNREHTYLNDLLKRVVNGELSIQEATSDREAQCITSYMGMGSLKKIDLPDAPVPALPGDKFLLMSDGVYNALSLKELTLALQHPADEAASAIESFINTKNYPNQDNYTVVILECH